MSIQVYFLILLRQLSLEYFMRSNEGESQGRKPQEYLRISRFSDAEFLLQDKQKNSRFSWWSNIILCAAEEFFQPHQ